MTKEPTTVTTISPMPVPTVSYQRHDRRRGLLGLAAVATMLLGAAACGDDDDTTAADTTREPTSSTTDASATGDDPVVRDGEPWVVFHGVELGLTLARLDGTGVHTILEGETVHPDWSPDGSEIAYVDAEAGEVWITDVGGERPRPLVETYPTELAGLYWEDPAWSRDGTRIAMVGYGGNPNGTPDRAVLTIVDIATGELTVAAELALADGYLISFPRWSPAGDALVMNLDHFTGQNYDGGTVAVARETGGTWSAPEPIIDLGQFGRVDWHPTEDLIVFGEYDIGGHQDTDEPTNLFTIRPDGSEQTAVTTFGAGETRATQPTWTSDGRILFAYVTGQADEDRAVALIDADGTNLEIVIEPDLVGEHNRPHPRLRPVASDASPGS